MSTRRTSSIVAASLVAATGFAVAAAGPAFAKSSIALSVSAHSVARGEHIGLTASGASDDFGGDPLWLCVDERVGRGAWRVVRCGEEGTLRLTIRTDRAGALSFRSQLLARTGHGRFVVDRTSQTVTVHVH